MMNNVFQPLIEKTGGVNKACKYIANRLNNKWTWKYIYHVYKGTVTPSKKLRAGLNALKIPNPTPKRYRKIIEATGKKQLDEWNKLTADELRHALDREVILRRIR